jgi:hypothetical protein
MRPAAGKPARRRRQAIARLLGLALAVSAAFACYLRQSRTVPVGSDGASQALQAWDLLHGNPLLHGWWVTGVASLGAGVTTARAVAAFGPPAVSYRYKQYEILTWGRGVNLLADLRR